MSSPGRRKRADSRYADHARRLASALRELREHAGKTQEQVAANAGIAVATVRKIETGAVTEPGYFTVLGILRAVGGSLEDLAAAEGKP